MLSEHEIIELLEQLKLGALHGVASESDPVGHWPVLVGDGLCLSLQSAARAEFVAQPETVTVISGLSNNTSLASICSQYRQVHHVSTGLHNRSLLIGYDSRCLGLLPQLHKTDNFEQSAGQDDELCHSSYTYDFSLAIAASLDPAAHLDGANHPVAFLPLEFDEHVRVAGGWRIALQLGDERAEFFIGLLNPDMPWVDQADPTQNTTAAICVTPLSVSKTADISEISVVFETPKSLEQCRTTESEWYRVKRHGDSIEFEKDQKDSSVLSGDTELMVQRSLQLSVDDLYLLLVEAIGGEVSIRIAFEIDSAQLPDNDPSVSGFPVGEKFRCVSVNNLPIRHAEIEFDGINFRLTSYD